MVKLIEISVPEYTVNTEPDHKSIGKVVDKAIKEHFLSRAVLVRGISSDVHTDKTLNQLIDIIKSTGTDRYDPKRLGDRYENIQGKRIDLFAFRRQVSDRMQLFRHISWGFYHGSKAIHGKPVRIDILTVYDASQLKAVMHQYEGREDIKRDGYVFKHSDDKPSALIGIIKIS